MPSLRSEGPLMVNKGTQCKLISYAHKTLESEFPSTFSSFNLEEFQQSTSRDIYHANIIGDVNSMSLGPTIIYKLDPDATKEILLGSPGIIDKLDVCGCILTSAGTSSGSCKREPINDENVNCISGEKIANNNLNDVMEESEQNRGAKSGPCYISSPPICTKGKKQKCNIQTRIIHPRWWSCRHLFNEMYCERISSYNNKRPLF